jgi:hypothetical protein
VDLAGATAAADADGLRLGPLFAPPAGQSPQRPPERSMCTMPEITRRSSTRRAPGWLCGRCGAITAHASSDSQNSDFDTISLQRNSALERHESPEAREINPLIKYRP